MPKHIDLAQVKAMKVVNYATLRETLKSGDLFFRLRRLPGIKSN